ncbi:EAL domain-containing protein [Thalassospira sp. ER-Se-21-Dark]|uniref:two-component system response regulator n=1 Tax=Thalassospira sp. ER-Se-21-Dark TaxID=2585190 RepID=UPI001B30E873|nr:EAL domain-containing protein [Thalassospira sp. ER-Se-21-Dark]MBP3127799.1 EAL domain-containing protein [Thalassospira sp. ER-Se-21-Dark]
MPHSVHVMIVEDERVIALHLRKQLEKLGYERTSAHTRGSDALAAINDDPPDIILMDIRIEGDIDGIETAAGIPPHLMIPVIYLSAHSEDATLARAQKTRPYGYLIKPFSDRELHATIQMALERRAAELALSESQHRLSLAMNAAQMSCWEIDVLTRQMHCTGLGNADLNQNAETVTESWDAFLERVATEDRDMVRKAFAYAVAHGDFYDVVFRSLDKDQNYRWLRARGKSFGDDRKGSQRIIGMMQDITDQRLTQDKLREAMTVFETTQDGILILDPDLNVTNANNAYYRITGETEENTLQKPPYFLSANEHPAEFFQELFSGLGARRQWHRDLDTHNANRGPISLSLQNIAVENEEHELTHYVMIVSDRTAIRQAEQELHYLAQYDGLTSLPNRLLATDRLNRAIERCEPSGMMVACMFLDIDDFKTINDTLGHAAGDQVILIAATRIKGITERTDTISRLGGDEFLIIRENIPNETAATNLAQKIIQELQRPFYIRGHEMNIGASVGISLYPQHGRSSHDLIRLADTAMYAAKDRGRRTFALYQPEMTANAAHYMTRSLELRRGLENGELVLYYQPQFDGKTGEMAGVEALLRWNHPVHGLVGPHEIIPTAEKSGLILEIGNWVIREACHQARRWQDEYGQKLRVAVNVSVRQMQQPGFADSIADELAISGLPAEDLEIEVTESMIQDEISMIQTLHDLRAVGISLAIDDFGTGYSCLRSIKSLPISRIKIDRAFVNGLPGNSNDVALINAMLAMAEALGLSVTAEGVETRAQYDFLRDVPGIKLQGFLLGKPVPAEDVFTATIGKTKQI